MTAVDATVLERLRAFDTATICNVIELFAIRPRTEGYMDQRITASFSDLPPAVGYASTATFRASSPPRGRDAYADLDEQVEGFAGLSGPAFVVFQDLDDPSVAATFGEVMCTVYRAFGAVGLVTSGTGRDLDQVRALDFPPSRTARTRRTGTRRRSTLGWSCAWAGSPWRPTTSCTATATGSRASRGRSPPRWPTSRPPSWGASR